MTTRRRGTWIALIAAVAVLLTSVGLATAYAANGGRWPWTPAPSTATGPASDGTSPYWDGNNDADGYGGMMGQGPYDDGWDRWDDGMMGRDHRWNGDAAALTQAQAVADSWLASNRPGATASQVRPVPVGYVFRVTENGQTVGALMVNDDTGAVRWRPISPSANPSPSRTA